MKPNSLKYGDTIGIISPCIALTPEYFATPLSVLESKGFKVKLSENIFKNTHGYAASEKERADDFNSMISDDNVKMILFGGGYVCNEILPFIDFENIKMHSKIICSYSDGTALLNIIYSITGLITYYGQSPKTFNQLTDYNYSHFKANFMSMHENEFEKTGEWLTICTGACEGTLIGGYIENFALLLGGQYFSYDNKSKYILFLEDHEKFSKPERVSMLLSHIEQSKFMKNVTGILFGHYSLNKSTELINILKRCGERNHIPVVSCDDFGHGINNAILPIGLPAKMDANTQKLMFV